MESTKCMVIQEGVYRSKSKHRRRRSLGVMLVYAFVCMCVAKGLFHLILLDWTIAVAFHRVHTSQMC